MSRGAVLRHWHSKERGSERASERKTIHQATVICKATTMATANRQSVAAFLAIAAVGRVPKMRIHTHAPLHVRTRCVVPTEHQAASGGGGGGTVEFGK